ncbi:MAG: divergent polysaccharide deacetylase family protein, partial [Gammaproteobacteria bacterium]
MSAAVRCRPRFWQRTVLLLAAMAAGSIAAATAPPEPSKRPVQQQRTPVISIIIDDLGYRLDTGEQATRLPGPVACAILPRSPHAGVLARLAHQHGKEVILHLPMQSEDYGRLDPGGLTLHMTRREFLHTLAQDLADVPYVSGVNNHMGSLLTQHPGDMAWLMRALARRGLFFVDSRTTRRTVAEQVALETGLPTTRRNVFLDDSRDPDAIRAQFFRLLVLARRDGSAVAIGHPYPHTMAVLQRELPQLQLYGVRLVPVRRLIALQQAGRRTWQASVAQH